MVNKNHAEYLILKTKDELNFLRKYYNVKNASNLKKELLASAICDFFNENLNHIAETMFVNDDINLLKNICANNGTLYISDSAAIEDLNSYNKFGLATIGIIICDKVDGGYNLSLGDDLKKTIETLVLNNNSLMKEISYNQRIINITKGLIELYGVVELDTLFNAIKSTINNSIELDEFAIETLVIKYIERDEFGIFDGSEYVHSAYMDNSSAILHERSLKSDCKYKSFEEKELIASISWKYSTLSRNEKKLADFFIKCEDMSKDTAAKEVKNIVYFIKNNFKPTEIITELTNNLSSDEFNIISEINFLVMDLHSNTPLWTLKGNTIASLAKQNNAVPTALFRNNPVIEELNNFVAVTNVSNETKKVGRNEPCPCGSGKKYKRCCGK